MSGSRRVSLFVTCIVDQVYPEVGMAAADVLQRLGYIVDFPEEQTCCGQPAFNTGYRREAKEVACRCLRAVRDAEYVVVPSGSCVSMIVNHYEEMFGDDAARSYEVMQFLSYAQRVVAETEKTASAVIPCCLSQRPSVRASFLPRSVRGLLMRPW